MKRRYYLFVLLAFLLAACIPAASPTPMVVVVVVTATPEETVPQPDKAETQLTEKTTPVDAAVPFIPSVRAGDYAGQQVTVRIERAWCSYQQQIKGEPTFCNDQPYPQYDFTLLIWGEDWSAYDGLCLLVSGMVTRYQGKPQIIAESRNQVSLCR